MAKYSEIMKNPWINQTLYADSIPHLLHYDLAYLWILEKETDSRPANWRERVEAWRCLTALLLVGELDTKDEAIEEPLLKYTKANGITKISWVHLKNTTNKIGVLSPTVLVRPLPDFRKEDLQQCRQRLAEKSGWDELSSYFAHLAIERLKKNQRKDSFQFRLAELLRREFKPKGMSNPPPGNSLSIPILRSLLWSQKAAEPSSTDSGESSSVDYIDIFVGGGGGNGKVYVPRCKECSQLLTHSQEALPIDATGAIEMTCDNGHQNELDLSDFMIWVRDEKEVILWDRQGMLPHTPERGLPPEPKPVSRGIQIEFEWNQAQLGGHTEKRFLKFQFPDRNVVKRKIEEIFFKKLLVIGKFEDFSGVPVRPEWLDAVANLDEIDRQKERITYRGMQLKGLPVVIDRSFGSLSLEAEPKLGAGIYPNPRFVPDKWQWYRIFLDGPERKRYRIQTSPANEILPWLAETTVGFNDSFSVIQTSNKNTGTTFYPKVIRQEQPSLGTTQIPLGIDFGTSNTIIYYLLPGKGIEDVLSKPREYCFEPRKLSEVVQWVAKSELPETCKTIGDFLPLSSYGHDRSDPYIIASALWSFDNKFLIRWESEKVHEHALPLRGFKWDDPGIDHSQRRKAFLRELLLLALPMILKRGIEQGVITTLNLAFRLGFSYPLSFGKEARDKMKELQDEIKAVLSEVTGFGYEVQSLNESMACMRLLGGTNSTDTVLVADMGGGTMDVALFAANSNTPDQIGSVRFAGESYLSILNEKKGLDPWELRDLILQGQCHRKYGGDKTAQEILSQFIGISFEFLRTMAEAHRKERRHQTIHLVLAGNGWHLSEAFSGQTDGLGAQQVFSNNYNHIVKILDDEKFQLSNPLSDLPSYKHLVAIGALKHAAAGGGNELASAQPITSKLPAGRALKFTRAGKPAIKIKWSQVVGQEIYSQAASWRDLQTMDLHIDLDDMPPLKGNWRSHVLDFFEAQDEGQIPRPNVLILLEQIRQAIPQEGAPLLTKGPLQIILEKHWIEWLSNKGGSK
jgi:hypothetical protein